MNADINLPDIPTRATTPSVFSVENDEVLQDHLVRVQKTLFDVVDKQVADIEARLKQKDYALKTTEEEKQNIAIELYRSKQQVDKLNDVLGKISGKLSKVETEKALEASQRVTLERNLTQVQRERQNLEKNLDQTRKNLEEYSGKIRQLNDLNDVFSSDLKIQRKLQQNYKREMALAESKRKNLEVDLDLTNKTVERLNREKRDLEQTLSLQKHETMIAQNAINNMSKELQQLKQTKKQLEKQWEDAVAAMSKRDSTFQVVQSNQERNRERLQEIEKRFGAINDEREEASKKVSLLETHNQKLVEQIEALKTDLVANESKSKDLRSAVSDAQSAELHYKQLADKLAKEKQGAFEKLQRKKDELERMKVRMEKSKAEFNSKMKETVNTSVARREEQLYDALEAEVQRTERKAQGKTSELSNENARLRLQMKKVDEELTSLKKENSHLKTKFNEVNDHYFRLYEEMRMTVGSLERKEHDINVLKMKLEEKKSNVKSTTTDHELQNLRKELQESKAEQNRLQALWLESQKEQLKAKDKTEKIISDNDYLRTQLGITETISIKTNDDIERIKKDAIEQKMMSTRYYLELKQIKPELEQLRRRNEQLQQQLVEANFKLQEAGLEGRTAVQMLKQEVHRLYDERKSTKKSQISEIKTNLSLEKKYQLAKEMVEKFKADKVALQRQNIELRSKLDDTHAKYLSVKLEYKKFQELTQRKTQEKFDKAGLAEKASKPGWASFASTPGGPFEGKNLVPSQASEVMPIPKPGSALNAEKVSPEVEFELPDISAMRLQINSLSREREFLLNENEITKRRNEETSAKLQVLERQIQEYSSRVKALEEEAQQRQTTMKNLKTEAYKARRIAAIVENQFRDAKPNVKIDYHVEGEVEPSMQLLAALMETDNQGNSEGMISDQPITVENR